MQNGRSDSKKENFQPVIKPKTYSDLPAMLKLVTLRKAWMFNFFQLSIDARLKIHTKAPQHLLFQMATMTILTQKKKKNEKNE